MMAGCHAQFPILLAALECIAQPEMNHRDMQVSGHTEAPLILVNGPVASQAGINYGTSAMGPGVVNKANTAIGRALRLCLINIGYCKAGAGDPNFIGLPTKFGMCIAENEDVSPWQPYHWTGDSAPDDSAVTVVTVHRGPTDVLDTASRNAEDTLSNIASMMFYRHAGGGSWIKGRQSAQVGHTSRRVEYKGPYHPIMLSPSRAVILAEAGMSKRDTQEWLHERCRVSLREAIGSGVPTDAYGKWLHHPELQHLADDPDATIAALEDPEQYLLFVTGGSTHYANFFYGTYGIATMPVEDMP